MYNHLPSLHGDKESDNDEFLKDLIILKLKIKAKMIKDQGAKSKGSKNQECCGLWPHIMGWN